MVDVSELTIPQYMGVYIEWMKEKGFKNGRDIIKYAEDEGIKSLNMFGPEQNGVVDAVFGRPYIICSPNTNYDYFAMHYFNTQHDYNVIFKNKEYIGSQVLNPSISAEVWRTLGMLPNAIFMDLNSQIRNYRVSNNTRYNIDLLKNPITIDDALNAGILNASMYHTEIPYGGNYSLPNYSIGHIHPFALQTVCWGNVRHDGIYYLDELIGATHQEIRLINWMDMHPLDKHISQYKNYLKEEKKRLATLKRKEKLDSELTSYTDYVIRKEIKFNNKNIQLLKGNCPDGIYFDLVKIRYILNKYRTNSEDIFGNAKHGSFNIQLYAVIQQLNNLTDPTNRITQTNGWWPQFHRFMIDLCGEEYNLRSSHEGWNRGISNWTTWGVRDVASVWFLELMNSGLDLSYYIVDKVDETYYGKNIKIAEDTFIFDFNKKGGPLSKSKYYEYIRKGAEGSGSSGGHHLLPKWMFIEYKDGEGYRL